MITRNELIKKYLEFFKSKGHKEIRNSSIIPENDPTVLFTTAGMHPLTIFLLGEKHSQGKRLCNVQRCIRTVDIDRVGNSTHHTFFEMLGNWSLGDYSKEEAIKMTFEFHTKILGIPLERYAITVFKGDKNAPRDEDSYKIWRSLGLKEERISFLPKEDNWWETASAGPCGPCTEQFYWKLNNIEPPDKFNSEDRNWVEIGNDVLMQYVKDKDGSYLKANQKNIDFGGGVERTLAVLNGLDDNYLTECFLPIIKEVEKISCKSYKGNEKAMRIIADHVKAATFILGDERGIKPSNIGQGYVLRRLIRRAIRYGRQLEIKDEFTSKIVKSVLSIYTDYPELQRNMQFIEEQLKEEERKFSQTLEKGLDKFRELERNQKITGKEAFLLFQSFGFPIEMTQELAAEKEIKVDLEEYNREFKKHRDLSRTSSAGTFKSGLADDSTATKKLHTATHLLNETLRKIVSPDIKQKGSNITPERLRFDFNFPRKLTQDEIKKVEDEVNKVISLALPVTREEISFQDALNSRAQAEFGAKYPAMVSVYTIGKDTSKEWYSKEICTGPHVENTKEIGHLKIVKEESVAAGIRRIKAVLK